MHYDIKPKKSYADFVKVTNEQKPYKNSKSWPLGFREYSQKHFVLRDDGTIDIFYGNRAARERGEECEKLDLSNWMRKRHLATVHPNNTVSFNALYCIS